MDVRGIREGPYLGRQRALNKKPKLFNGLKFYIMGDFEHAYKGYLQDLIVVAEGTILRRRPVSNDKGNDALTIIVFSVEPNKTKTLTQRRSDEPWLNLLEPELQAVYGFWIILQVINKTDLAAAVGQDVSAMERDALRIRDGGPFVFAQVKHGLGVEEIVNHVLHSWEYATRKKRQ